MTDQERKAMEMALEALDGLSEPYDVLKAQEALRQALAQPEQSVDLLLQSAQEGWRWAKECEAEVQRLKECLFQMQNAAADLSKKNQELVEALEMMTDRFRDTEGYYGSYEQEALDVAHAALNKARGIE